MRISDWSSDVCSSDLLTRLAYEVILSAALTMIDAAPRRRMSLGELTDELADAVEIASGESWDDFSGGINAEAEVSSAQQYATRSEEHTSELQSLMRISYAVFCLKKKTKN